MTLNGNDFRKSGTGQIVCPKCRRHLGFRTATSAHLNDDVVTFDRSGTILCRHAPCDGKYVFRVKRLSLAKSVDVPTQNI